MHPTKLEEEIENLLPEQARNRTLNSVLYSISLHQSRFDKIGSEYFSKKLQEGKSNVTLANVLLDKFLT